MSTYASKPRFGIQGPVVALEDPWAGERSDAIMRTGTGVTIASQDPASDPESFVGALKELHADFYVHHLIPTEAENTRLLSDLNAAGIDLVLGNEYGNINGPYVEGTNRFDLPSELVREASEMGVLAGVLYDEPEHVQIHADQYRKDAFLPHFGDTTGLSADDSIALIDRTVRGIVQEVREAAQDPQGKTVPVLAEHVFPLMFHTLARAGMTPAPKVMKESFQPLQLSTALGAAQQYGRDLWICADLWGPDIGPWFTRAPGLPGHSPAEFASALRMAYLFAPTSLFVENMDVLVRNDASAGIVKTVYGEVWDEFVRDFVPAHPLRWQFADAAADIVLIHAEDSDFGRHHQPFGNRQTTAPETAGSIFEAWNLLSHGSIPAHGNCLHIPGYDFPRAQLDGIPRDQFPLEHGAPEQTRMHGLFHASRNVLVFDEHVQESQLGSPELILVVGSRLPQATLAMLRSRAENGSTVIIARWLTATDCAETERLGQGLWVVFDTLQDEDVREATAGRLGKPDEWTQRFGDTTIRMTPGDVHGETLEFEIEMRTAK